MGVNISQYLITEVEGKLQATRTNFDFIRYTGDPIVASADGLDCEYLELGDPRDGDIYWRPQDIDKAIKWCNQKLPTDWSKNRWIKEFEKMRTDKNLWFHNGW